MITERERDALNLIRWISTFSIVLCHFLQAFNNKYAFIFNVGVQIFFLLSGFLYGDRLNLNYKLFYKKRFIKLYIPYLIWVTIATILLIAFAPHHVTVFGFFKQLIMRSNLPGLDHLWFMYVIFICYLILPFVNELLKRNAVATIMAGLLSTSLLLYIKFDPYILWIFVYYIGYLMGRYKNIVAIFMFASFVITVAMLYLTSFSINAYLGSLKTVYIIHASTGILCFAVLYVLVKCYYMPRCVSHLLTKWGGTRYTLHTTSFL